MASDRYAGFASCNAKKAPFRYSASLGNSVRNSVSSCIRLYYSSYSIYNNITNKGGNRGLRAIWEIGVTTVTSVTASARAMSAAGPRPSLSPITTSPRKGS